MFWSNKIRVKRYGKTSVLRKHQNKYLRELTSKLNVSSVLNLGAVPLSPDKEKGTYEDYFPTATFTTFDLSESDHPNHIKGDLMDDNLDIGQFDLVLAMSVIEHIDKPWIAAPVISNLIKPGGHLFVAMPWFYPVHKGPGFGDHWRITPSGLEHLFEDLSLVQTEHFPTSIKTVCDRKTYWNDENSTACGFAALFRTN